MRAERLAVEHVAAVEAAAEVPWLVEGLWPEQGVGLLGGHPKSCKSWLALDIALSVATRTPVLGRYPVRRSGGVLVFAAEDSPSMVRARFAGLAAARGVDLSRAPIQLVLESSLRLESSGDQARLRATLEELRPVLLVLDPFVRMTGIDENSAQEVSRVLAYLRGLQRSLSLAILVVHHVRKSAGHGGLALRGSGDFWAWSDTNLYLARKQAGLELAIEHRSASTPEPVRLELTGEPPAGPYLQTCEPDPDPFAGGSAPLRERVLDHLRGLPEPARQEAIRDAVRARMQTVVDVLRDLEEAGDVERTALGWRAVPDAPGPTETDPPGHPPNQTLPFPSAP